MCAKSGHFTTAPCLNRKSMHHFIREGGGSPKSLPLVQSPGAQTNKEDIKNLHSEREGNCLPSVVPTQFQGQWRHTTHLDKACPIVTLNMRTFSSPVTPNHLSATEFKYRKGTQHRRRQGRGLTGQGQAKTETKQLPMVQEQEQGQGLCQKLMRPVVDFNF